MKIQKKGGKWHIFDGRKTVEFDDSGAAWKYIFLMLQISRKVPAIPRKHAARATTELYPVRSLVPHPKRGACNA